MHSSTKVVDQVMDTFQIGTWRVSFYEKGGVNETKKLGGYIYSFKSGLTCSQGIGDLDTSYEGTWAMGTSTHNVDNLILKDTKLDIDLIVNKENFPQINYYWDILERTETKISLKTLSYDNKVIFLTFEKN